ncbi:MAG: SDR family NAD(P)-dependent oxidoreductase [Candidatus Saccharimonadales bacterium]
MATAKKIAVVTGTSRGLGVFIAKEFAANGWQVLGTGRSERSNDLSPEVKYHQFDASDAAAASAFWEEVASKYKGTEVCLVNNAGGYVGGALVDTDPEAFIRQIESIYLSAVFMTRGLVSQIAKARIINVVSAGALKANKNNSAYGAAKAAEMHFFQSLQAELDSSKYQITNLYPDMIASQGSALNMIDAGELANFIRQLAEADKSYYLPDVTISAKRQD